jgi:alkanesulfonate monooxygenase SsuD/methylene tetrahydromethanopterin reductase-like flavin-dependent oxidoreductase (luciferase family)
MTGGRLRIGFQVWGQYVTWDELMAMGREIDAMGFDELWANDHFVPPIPAADGQIGQLHGPIFEAWSTLFGWAAVTHHVRTGCLVSGAGYRNPALLVKMATALDHATGGRAVLGLGGGWLEREHVAFGFEFPPLGQRIDRFAEAAAICRGLLDGEAVTMAGQWFSAVGATNDPPPVQQRLPLAIGGSGEKRTLRIVATYADIWNADGDDPDSFRRRSAILDEHCQVVGRDPTTIERTAGLAPPCIRSTREEAIEALASTLERQAIPRSKALEMASGSPFAGTVDSVVARLRDHRDAGLGAAMFDWPAPYDRATLDALAGPVRDALTRDGEAA